MAGRVTNPGCYATGAIALLRPLVGGELVPADWPVTINAVSGYSGGGKALIAAFEDPQLAGRDRRQLPPLRHGRGAEAHRRDAELRRARRPAAVHPERRPLRAGHAGVRAAAALGDAAASRRSEALHAALAERYAGEQFVTVVPLEETLAIGKASSLDARNPEPEGLNDTNRMTLSVYGSPEHGQAVLLAKLDNLGKGASGQAVQNLNLMLGLDEAAGLN